jgi:lipopolysaccharide/colanic/teichoic acid biosynthesis glycosyltransferase
VPPIEVRLSTSTENLDGITGGLGQIPTAHVPYAAAKRAADVSVSLLALALGFPLFLGVALLVKATSRGPVLFKQTRVGVGGRLFTCYKYRSMYLDAEARLEEVRHLNELSGPVFKIKDDPRITPVGRFIRKASLDELPQFFNVLCGEMSLVGPRPPIPEEVRKYGARERGRLAVRPGLTCLWQIGGRSSVDFERWVELDLDYIRTMSFWGDLLILLKTIPAVLTARGAC